MHYLLQIACSLFPLLCLVSTQAEAKRRAGRPYFFPTPTNITYSVGDTATLRCGVRNRGSKTVTWRRLQDVTPLTLGTFGYTSDKRISSTHNKFKQEWNLHVENIKMKDMGVYECQVSTKQAMSKHFFLNVLERQTKDIPKPGIVVSGTDILEVGQPISLTCNATGKTEMPRDVEWFKGSERVVSNSRTMVEISKFKVVKERSLVSYLVIERSRIDDGGTYLCRSSDKETDTLQVHVLNAATYNVKRGTEKSSPYDKPRGSVKKQLQPNVKNKGYFNIQSQDDRGSGERDASRRSEESSHRGRASHLSPFIFQTFVAISFLSLQCRF